MYADCHIHMILDGVYYKDAMAIHKERPNLDWIHKTLSHYQALGFDYLRDGGDRWDVGATAKRLAPQYGITYRSPIFPIHKKGHYGGFIGRTYDTPEEYKALLQEAKEKGADFIKIMISGLMDFDHYGTILGAPLEAQEIRDLVDRAHDMGFSVMVHANGPETVIPAAESKVDSVEHGAFLNTEALHAMKEAGAVWVPTLSTIANLLRTTRFDCNAVSQILSSAQKNLHDFHCMGGIIAPGSDAGAYAVFHGEGGLDEYQHLKQVLGKDTETALSEGIAAIKDRF